MMFDRRYGRWAVALSACAAVLGGADASAHEFWLEPASFAVERGGPLGIRLCVGDGFEGWSLARNNARVETFVAAGPAGLRPVVGLEGADPAGIVRLTEPGGYVIAYRSRPALTELPAAEFDRYLEDKGLQRIAAVQGSRRIGSDRVREAYSRHAKALVRVGATGDAPVDRVLGLRLELLAEPQLMHARPGDRQSFQLLFEGRPLAGALITAARPGTADTEQRMRTGVDGRASFRLAATGRWRIAAVHMVEATPGVDVEWESLWASLTFELQPSDAIPGAACRNQVADARQVRR